MEEKKMQELDVDQMEKVSGGTQIHVSFTPVGTEDEVCGKLLLSA